MPTAKIAKVETVTAGINTDLFDPFNDPITLRMTINYSPDIFQLPSPTAWRTFEIIELRTDTVFEHMRFQKPIPFPLEYAWVDLPTASGLGLNWTSCDIFGFRGAVEVFSDQAGAGLIAIDAFDVSLVHWFRLKAVFRI